jgi:hypothetical protein
VGLIEVIPNFQGNHDRGKDNPDLDRCGLTGFALVTWWAPEWSGVAIVTTQSSDGELRKTHIWYSIDGEEIWLEAGTDENPWFVEV